jgi:hypothetical protein
LVNNVPETTTKYEFNQKEKEKEKIKKKKANPLQAALKCSRHDC